LEPTHLALVMLWIVAGGLALRFGLGNARVWRGMAVGFLLIPVSELVPLMFSGLSAPLPGYARAMGNVVGIAAILAISHSLQEYYAFTQTLEERGSKLPLGLVMVGAIAAALLLLLASPEPTAVVQRAIRIVENTNWVFLSVINIGLIRKIRSNLENSPVSRGFVALTGVFACIVLWKGCELYLDVYPLDLFKESSPLCYQVVRFCGYAGNLLAGLGAGAAFTYLARLLR
jgi:hypothetical protein